MSTLTIPMLEGIPRLHEWMSQPASQIKQKPPRS
jgi:hypothetical protein